MSTADHPYPLHTPRIGARTDDGGGPSEERHRNRSVPPYGSPDPDAEK
jgi:hypothetical protein